MLLEDLLVIDAPALYKRRTRGGALYALEVLDGATIKRLIDDWGRTPLPPAPAYQQILKGVPAVDYGADELIYAPRNPRVHKAYGFSPVEQVQMSVNIALRRQIYQLQYYTEGNVPEALIGVPENWNPDQIRQFQAYWDSLNAGDTAERRHAKFVPGGVAKTFVPVREPAMKDAFDEWLARVVCYVFSVPPSAFTGQVNRATADTAQDVALSEGMAPLQRWVKHLIDRVHRRGFRIARSRIRLGPGQGHRPGANREHRQRLRPQRHQEHQRSPRRTRPAAGQRRRGAEDPNRARPDAADASGWRRCGYDDCGESFRQGGLRPRPAAR